ncbi:hypothetical protein GIB67_036787 [Kingdonia uniflora]|uniref:Uncharacterized protein n=1 Tax=Kingdonia uniflora TaxID=39325 RepID=A0A7J7LWZ5_9MAGN|nr:hypothetical protein GIB67_036787 [Kingdonia uniflora]
MGIKRYDVIIDFIYTKKVIDDVWKPYAGELEKAIEHFTKAILLNPTSAIMYGPELIASASAKVVSFDKRVGLTNKINVEISVVNEKVKSMDQRLWKDFMHNERETGVYNGVKGVNVVMGHC